MAGFAPDYSYYIVIDLDSISTTHHSQAEIKTSYFMNTWIDTDYKSYPIVLIYSPLKTNFLTFSENDIPNDPAIKEGGTNEKIIEEVNKLKSIFYNQNSPFNEYWKKMQKFQYVENKKKCDSVIMVRDQNINDLSFKCQNLRSDTLNLKKIIVELKISNDTLLAKINSLQPPMTKMYRKDGCDSISLKVMMKISKSDFLEFFNDSLFIEMIKQFN